MDRRQPHRDRAGSPARAQDRVADGHGRQQGARIEISAIKVAAPDVALRVIDRAIQAHGALGGRTTRPLASMYAHVRTLRLADGPDEVHRMSVARRELRKYEEA